MPAEEITRTLSLLFAPGQVVEVRAITEEGMASGYFDDPGALTAAVAPMDVAGTAGVYVTLNEVNPALLSRRANRIRMRLSKKDATTADTDIVRRRWFPVDIDPVRPSGVSSTDEEHQAALVRAAEVAAYLGRERGWPAPIMADSGNGAHLLYRIDLPNDEACRDLVKRCLEVLDVLFSNRASTIDTTNFNAARIWKLYGTVSRKGDHPADRPHRRASLIDAPDEPGIVTRDMLRELAGLLPVQPPPPENGQRAGVGRPAIDLRTWLCDHGIAVADEKPYQGGTLFVLEECPFSGAHRDGAFAIQFGSGAVYAGCHHASCGGGSQRWKELRERYEKRGGGCDRARPPARAERRPAPPGGVLSSSSVAEGEPLYDAGRWTVTVYEESPFEKVGRLYLDGGCLVVRSDLDTRGFSVLLADMSAVLSGEPQAVRLLMAGEVVGVVSLSASGKAVNVWIDPVLYMAPLARVMDVLEGQGGEGGGVRE
jgi:hypothetical protein